MISSTARSVAVADMARECLSFILHILYMVCARAVSDLFVYSVFVLLGSGIAANVLMTLLLLFFLAGRSLSNMISSDSV